MRKTLLTAVAVSLIGSMSNAFVLDLSLNYNNGFRDGRLQVADKLDDLGIETIRNGSGNIRVGATVRSWQDQADALEANADVSGDIIDFDNRINGDNISSSYNTFTVSYGDEGSWTFDKTGVSGGYLNSKLKSVAVQVESLLEDTYDSGYSDGYSDGFEDGVNSVKGIIGLD